MRRAMLLAVVVALWATAGCGDDDTQESTGSEATSTTGSGASPTTGASTGADSGAIDVCGLLDDASVSEVAGVAVTPESLSDASGAYGVCEWGVASEGYWRVRLTVDPANFYEILRSNDDQVADLDGLGDEAWSHQYGDSGDKLDIGVLAGDYSVLVFFDPIEDPAAGQALVQQIIEALGA